MYGSGNVWKSNVSPTYSKFKNSMFWRARFESYDSVATNNEPAALIVQMRDAIVSFFRKEATTTKNKE